MDCLDARKEHSLRNTIFGEIYAFQSLQLSEVLVAAENEEGRISNNIGSAVLEYRRQARNIENDEDVKLVQVKEDAKKYISKEHDFKSCVEVERSKDIKTPISFTINEVEMASLWTVVLLPRFLSLLLVFGIALWLCIESATSLLV